MTLIFKVLVTIRNIKNVLGIFTLYISSRANFFFWQSSIYKNTKLDSSVTHFSSVNNSTSPAIIT